MLNMVFLYGQTKVVVEGTVINSTITGDWTGVNIQRSSSTALIYRNNSITSVNSSGYMLQAGDETAASENNNLDGEVISGNKLAWNGSDENSITHGIFTGHNKNVIIMYNYLDKVPMAIIRKSTINMTNTSGGVAYNIVRNPMATAGVAKGMNNVSFYNNTFYSDLSSPWRGLIDIYSNTDISPNIASTGTKIKNNIFYTVNQIYNIAVHDAACLSGFESDYNVFYCESGTPVFNYLESRKTFAQWQALGYDKHSVVINPKFNNTTDFLPSTRLDYGTDLGTAWKTGLSTSATWTTGVSPATANQGDKWQAGARIYSTETVSPVYISSVVENASPSALKMTYSLSLAAVVPATSSFLVQVNSVTRKVNSIDISGSAVQLTLASAIIMGDIIKVTYTKPSSNPLQSVAGGIAASVSAQLCTNNVLAQSTDPVTSKIKITIYPNPAHKILTMALDYSQSSGISSCNLKMTDSSGNLFMERVIDKGVANVKFPINLKPGIYIVTILSNDVEVASQNVIVN